MASGHPSTLGSHLRAYVWGNLRQLEIVYRAFLAGLARYFPLLSGADVLAFVDIDAMQNASTATASRALGPGTRKSGPSHCWSGTRYSAGLLTAAGGDTPQSVSAIA